MGQSARRRCQAADFSKNGIGLKGITALCEALSHNQALGTLALDTNSIGDEGAEVLARFMASAALVSDPKTLSHKSYRSA